MEHPVKRLPKRVAILLFACLFAWPNVAQASGSGASESPRLLIYTNLTRFLLRESNLGLQYRFSGQWFAEFEGGWKHGPAFENLARLESSFSYAQGTGFRVRAGGGSYLAATNDYCFISVGIDGGVVTGPRYWLPDPEQTYYCRIVSGTRTVFGSVGFRFGASLPVFKFLHVQALAGVGVRVARREVEYESFGGVQGMNEFCFPTADPSGALYPNTQSFTSVRPTFQLGFGIAVPLLRR